MAKLLKAKKHVQSGSPEEAQELAKFQNAIANVNADFVDYVKNAARLQQSRDKMDEQSSALNQYFYRQMSLACAAPLMNGVNTSTILESMSVRLGMMLASPEFRMNSHISYTSSQMEKTVQKLNDSGSNDKRLQEKYNHLYNRKYGRYPFTPESAALQEIGFTMRAYEQMRKPNANIDNVLRDYNNAVNVLHEQAAQDGISSADVKRNVRVIVGRMIEKDPSTAVYFNETVYGDVGRADYHPERVSEMVNGQRVDKSVMRWSGEFTDCDGNPYKGRFTPRQPMSARDQRNAYSDRIFSDLSKCEDASEVRDYFVRTEDDDVIDDDMRRLSMYQDGFTPEQIDTIRMDGMLDAICRFDKANSWFDTSRVFNEDSYESYSNIYDNYQNGVRPGDAVTPDGFAGYDFGEDNSDDEYEL